MTLFRVDTPVMNDTQRVWIREGILQTAIDSGAELVECQIGPGGDRLSFLFECSDGSKLRSGVVSVDYKATVTEVTNDEAPVANVGSR